MNILITGASGFIGRHLSRRISIDHSVVRIVSRNAPSESNEFVVDLKDQNDVKKFIRTRPFQVFNIDVIIHCAAVLGSAEVDSNDKTVFHDNIRITENMIQLANELKPKRLINLSTIGVYPNQSGIYTEESAVNPGKNAEALYSLSKFCGEELFSFYLKDIEVVNLRLSQTYGDGMKSDRIYAMYLDELKTNNTISVWGNGERASNFLSIEYCTEMIAKIVSKTKLEGTYNLGEKNISYLDLANDIISRYGNSESRIILHEKGVRAKVIISSSKLLKALSDE